VNDRALSNIDHNALMVEQARLARFFQSINKHRKALDLRSQIATSSEPWGPQRVALWAEWLIEPRQRARWS
jgi:hypothetical protein